MQFTRLVLTALLGPPLLVGAALCAVAASLAQLGRWSPTWDLFTHFAPIYLAAGVVAVLAAAGFSGGLRLPVLAAGLACVIAAGLLMVPEYERSTGPRAAMGAKPTFKVIQFNAWSGRNGQAKLLAWLKVEKPDVVVIEEANSAVQDALSGAGWWSVAGRSSVMLFTPRRPLAAIIPTDNAGGPMELNGVVVASPSGPVTVLGVHAPWPSHPTLKRDHDLLIPIVRSYPAATTILAGDFNSTPWSFSRQRDDRDFGLIRRTRAVFTWPIAAYRRRLVPVLPIDHVYAGAGWATVKVERGPTLGSDHYPVAVTLAPVALR
jgi:endonuclease/exonuclease/phosphatase (EEP) superfamily protein YafD